MGQFYIVSTSRRGKVAPHEPVSADTQRILEREYRQVARERDPALTEREWRQYEVARGSYACRTSFRAAS